VAIENYNDRTARYFYVKTGFQKDYFGFGLTAISLDVYLGHNVDVAASTSTSFGVSFVQNFDTTRAQFYGTIRNYQYARASGSTRFEDGVAVFSGIRLRF
jgi:hypothetical protein